MGERRPFSPQFKAERVLELLNGTHTLAEMCQGMGLSHRGCWPGGSD